MRHVPVSRLALVLALALIGPAAAVAETPAWAPASKSKAVVPGVSIGGLKLGQNYADMQKLWGKASNCGTADTTIATQGSTPIDRTTWSGDCIWGSPTDRYAGTATATFSLGKISFITLNPAQSTDTYFPIAKGPIAKYTITKGKAVFRVNSSLTKFAKAFPKAKWNGGGYVLTKGKTSFAVGSSRGKLSSMTLFVQAGAGK